MKVMKVLKVMGVIVVLILVLIVTYFIGRKDGICAVDTEGLVKDASVDCQLGRCAYDKDGKALRFSIGEADCCE